MIEAFSTDTATSWEDRLVARSVPASRVRKLSEVISEGQPAARGLLHEVAVGTEGMPVQLPGIGFLLNGDSLGPREAPRPVGSDNDTWLRRG
jgi:crotonobetainyl-CoA:carnitine CoA-transferase CaiB-like acyl-CoA transferase